MSHRCRDDTLWWLLLILAIDNANWRGACAAERRRDDFGADEYRTPLPNTPSAPAWRHPLAVAAFVLTAALVGAVIGRAVVADSAGANEPAAVVAAQDERIEEPLPADSPPVENTPIPADTLTLAAPIETLPNAIAFVPFAPEPLPSRAIVGDAGLAPEAAITRAFGIGSSREDVIAAQGSAPTYAKGDTLWWGSSKVIFTRDGFVASWTQGTPPLRLRDRPLLSDRTP